MPRCIQANIDHQSIQPRGKLRVSAKLRHVADQFQENLLRNIGRDSAIPMKKIERDRISPILAQSVKRAKGVPVADTTGIDDLCADRSITQRNHQPMRRVIEVLSSIFSAVSV